MNKNLLIGVVVVMVIAFGGWFLFKDQIMPQTTPGATEQTTPSANTIVSTASPEAMMESTGSSTSEGVKEFTVTGSNFKFDKSEIRVNKGDTVKITFKNAGGFHDFVIDEFNVATKQGNGPSEETVTFLADKAGEYFFYCSVGQHRANGMEGKFIVE